MARPPAAAGFTLIEMTIVILLIGVLASVAVISSLRVAQESAIGATLEDVRAITTAAELCFYETGAWPSNQGNGVLPPELAPYVVGDPFAEPTPIGGLYDWDRQVNGSAAQLKIADSAPDRGVWQEIDRRIDDGDLRSGSVRLFGSASRWRLRFILED